MHLKLQSYTRHRVLGTQSSSTKVYIRTQMRKLNYPEIERRIHAVAFSKNWRWKHGGRILIISCTWFCSTDVRVGYAELVDDSGSVLTSMTYARIRSGGVTEYLSVVHGWLRPAKKHWPRLQSAYISTPWTGTGRRATFAWKYVPDIVDLPQTNIKVTNKAFSDESETLENVYVVPRPVSQMIS